VASFTQPAISAAIARTATTRRALVRSVMGRGYDEASQRARRRYRPSPGYLVHVVSGRSPFRVEVGRPHRASGTSCRKWCVGAPDDGVRRGGRKAHSVEPGPGVGWRHAVERAIRGGTRGVGHGSGTDRVSSRERSKGLTEDRQRGQQLRVTSRATMIYRPAGPGLVTDGRPHPPHHLIKRSPPQAESEPIAFFRLSRWLGGARGSRVCAGGFRVDQARCARPAPRPRAPGRG
jgi:hypothetical protein